MNNRIKEAFASIYAEDALKRSTKEFLFQQTKGYRKYGRSSYMNQVAAACICLLLAFCGWEGYSVYFTAVSTISVDVNPSIELEVNRFDRVIAVQSYNEDGKIISDSLKIRFMDYGEAVDLLFQNEKMAQYLNKELPVIVTVFGEDKKSTDEMLANLTAHTALHANVHCSAGDPRDAEAAHSMGFSCGKYRAYMELKELDPEASAEEIKGLTMHQIQNRIDALSGREPVSDTGYEHGHGYGHGGHE